MELNDFVAKFAEQFEDTDPAVFTPETEFRDIDEWSSMTGLLIMAMVSDEYDKTLTADEFRKCETVEDVFNVVVSK